MSCFCGHGKYPWHTPLQGRLKVCAELGKANPTIATRVVMHRMYGDRIGRTGYAQRAKAAHDAYWLEGCLDTSSIGSRTHQLYRNIAPNGTATTNLSPTKRLPLVSARFSSSVVRPSGSPPLSSIVKGGGDGLVQDGRSPVSTWQTKSHCNSLFLGWAAAA